MADRLAMLNELERKDGPPTAAELAALAAVPSRQAIARARRDERNAAASYWMKLSWVESCVFIAKDRMHGGTPLEESLGEIQLALDEARQAARRLDQRRVRLDQVEPAQSQVAAE